MDRTVAQWRFKEDDEVLSADEKKLGHVVAFFPDMTNPTHLVVQGGFLFHRDYWVPVSAVTNYDGRRIYVDATKDEAASRGWDRRPVIQEASAPATMEGMVVDPVCGMPVNPSEAPAQSRYQDRIYYFCSRECKQMFDAQPERYAMTGQPMPSDAPEQAGEIR
ncbi:MAG TPA: YHS domain-containing protein [Thermomicrobiales bacterium]